MADVGCVKLSCKLSVFRAILTRGVEKRRKLRSSSVDELAWHRGKDALSGRWPSLYCCLDDAAVFAISNVWLVPEINVSTTPVARTSHKCSQQPSPTTYRALAIAVKCSAATETTDRASLPTAAGALHRLRDSLTFRASSLPLPFAHKPGSGSLIELGS